MNESLTYTTGKFTFEVAIDRLYSASGLWVKVENGHCRLGLSDYRQQRNGDVAFAEVAPAKSLLSVGDELANVETIKVDVELTSPVSGKVVQVNPALEWEAECINLDPYDQGWLAVIEATDCVEDLNRLLNPEEYLSLIRAEVEREQEI